MVRGGPKTLIKPLFQPSSATAPLTPIPFNPFQQRVHSARNDAGSSPGHFRVAKVAARFVAIHRVLRAQVPLHDAGDGYSWRGFWWQRRLFGPVRRERVWSWAFDHDQHQLSQATVLLLFGELALRFWYLNTLGCYKSGTDDLGNFFWDWFRSHVNGKFLQKGTFTNEQWTVLL
jgi:hypothetical protein